MKQFPIACDLTPDELARRRSSLLAELVRRAREKQPTEAGYRFGFDGDADSARLVLATVEAERKCCRFLRFRVTFEQDLGPITLEIDGPEGARDFVESLFESGS